MNLLRKDQIEFANAILGIIGDESVDVKTLEHLNTMTSLFVAWSGRDNGVAVALSEYVGELCAIKTGSDDTGWKDEFKSALLRELHP